MAGAVCTITWLSGLSSAFQTSSIWSFSVMAPTGQTAAHWPHCTQATVVQVVVEGRADDRLEAAVLREQGADVLRLQADAHAAAALDALAAVADQGGRGGVDPLAGLLAVVGDLADAQLGGQGLQFAVFVAVAGLAVAVVLGEQQFDHRPAGLADAAGVGQHLHALGDRHRAGGDEVPRPFDLDHAHAAGADGLQAFDVAQRGDADAGLLRGRQDRGAFGHFDGDVVDRELDHEFSLGQSAVSR